MAKVYTWSQLGAPRGLVVSVLFFAIYMTAVRATALWHNKYGGADAAFATVQ